MSTETSQWLNNNVLVGYTDKRGTAWHYRAEEQGDEPNHYPGPIPVADIRRRLFHWTPVEGTVETAIVTEEGVTRLTDPTRKTIVRPDTGAVLGIFKQGFRIHEYNTWLVEHVETLLDADLQVGSAGLLKGGAVAWVQVEMDETVSTPEGVEFRPFLTAATSLDGSLSSTYQTGAQVVVCDNTLSAALGDTRALRVKIKHSRHSLGRVAEVRDALDIVHRVADDFAAEVKALCEITVTDQQWSQFLDAHILGEDKDWADLKGRGLTLAENRRDTLQRLYVHDDRVAPWAGTAYGVLAAVNTYTHHEGIVRGTSRVERNMLRMVTGGVDTMDRQTLDTLQTVLA